MGQPMGVQIPPSAPFFALRGHQDPQEISQAFRPGLFFSLAIHSDGRYHIPMKSTPLQIFLQIAALAAAAVIAPTSVAAQQSDKNVVAIIASPLANVHKEPQFKSGLRTQVLLGDEVRILEKQDYRYRIAIPSQGNIEGWIHREALQIPKDNGQDYLNAGRKRVIITVPKSRAMILDRTGNHKVSLYAGTRLPVVEATGDSYKVQFPDRTLAIISTRDARPVQAAEIFANELSPQDLAATAKQFLNVTYLDGGTTTQGMDTRGLIHVVYRIHGIPLAPDREALQSGGMRVQKNELQPGDILVFHGEGEGLYIGNGRFLQSIRKRSVQIGGIYDRRYANALQYGLRFLGADPVQKKLPVQLSAAEILVTQDRAAALPLGKRIAYWAARFIGTPYDPDPLGLYVRSNRIITDEKVDCMYHTFRAVELAMTDTPAAAVDRALDLRFITKGRLEDGIVRNYDERYQYGEDMVFGGKWGRNITSDLGTTVQIPGSRGKDIVDILPKTSLQTAALQSRLQDGDIIYWIKDPTKRVVEEIVAHLSIVRVKKGKAYVIHAAGDKDRKDRPGGGVVKEVPFADYVRTMKHIGALATRFEE